MIVGIGCDIVCVERVQRLWQCYAQKFVDRVFVGAEKERIRTLPAWHVPAFLASRIAAKEAAVKALGVGFSQGVRWVDIEVRSADSGAPFLVLSGQADVFFREKAQYAHISLAHERAYALAHVIFEN